MAGLISDKEIRKQLDRLFSREVLGAVLVGKFVGDYVAVLFVEYFGVDVGYISGTLVFILVFIYWEGLEDKVEDAENKLDRDQREIKSFNED